MMHPMKADTRCPIKRIKSLYFPEKIDRTRCAAAPLSFSLSLSLLLFSDVKFPEFKFEREIVLSRRRTTERAELFRTRD